MRRNGAEVKLSPLQRKQEKQCYLMLAIQIIGFLVFTIYPIGWAIRYAWYYYDGIPNATRFVGFENFVRIFTQDATYWRAWLTTIKFAIFKLPLELPLAMILALLINKKHIGNNFFRAMYCLPNIISVAIVGLILSNLFDYFGFINVFLEKANMIDKPIDWFANTGTAMAVLVIGSTWSTFGINILYFLSALANVPEELYESAYLDGASKLTIFFKITLPMMAPVLQTILLLSLNGTLQINDYVLVTTNGAPGGTTYTVMSYIVKKFVPGFASVNEVVNIGYGCALALVTAIILGVIAFGYSKLTNKLNNLY